ncbi:ISL3 family transposase, partial [Streptomyces sp. NPDC002793]
VVDVLPTREAGPLAAWLDCHPGVEIICRDRAGAHTEGARHGAPGALQVGLGRAVETCVAAHRDCLRTPAPSGTLTEATLPTSGGRKTTLSPSAGGPLERRPHTPW